MALNDEIVVAIAIGIPSCLIALLSLWVTHRTFALSVQLRNSPNLFHGIDEESSLPNTPFQSHSGAQDMYNNDMDSASVVALQHRRPLLQRESLPERCYSCYSSHILQQFVRLLLIP